VLGGGATGRAGSPELEYSQMSPPFAATGVALGASAGAATVAEGLGGWGATGIWPHPLSSAEIPTMARAVALGVATTVVLCHALTGFAGSDKP
jgi:hypothetical protein